MSKLVCIGGGLFYGTTKELIPNETKEIDEEIVKLANKVNPKFLFIGTASKENENYYMIMKKIYEDLGCTVSKLELLKEKVDQECIRNQILESDIVYIGGGHTRFMLEKWRELGVDKMLIEAYNKDIVLAGISAGSYCWFKYNYELIEGLGLIQAINCAHYDEKSEEQKEKFYNAVEETGFPRNCIRELHCVRDS